MAGYLVRRIAAAALVMAAVAVAVFLLIHLVPGDPVQAMLGDGAPDANVHALRRKLGLDQPLWSQFSRYVCGLARLDLGMSLARSRPVLDLLAERLTPTIRLGAAGLGLALVASVPLGVVAARCRGSFAERLISAASCLTWAFPSFWLAPVLLVLFAVHLRWFPVSGSATPAHLVLPAVTLALPTIGSFTLLVKARVEQTLDSEFIRALRARGVGERRLFLRHVMPNAMAPLASIVALQTGDFLTGAVVAETIFAWPGVGRLLVESITRRDYPVVQGCVLFFAALYAGVNLVGDGIHAAIDPRVRDALRSPMRPSDRRGSPEAP